MLNLKSKITIKLLGYYFLNPKAKNYTNELARILEVDVGNLSRKLKELEAEGFFNSEYIGNQKYYFLNTKYPLLKEVKSVYLSKYGLESKLANVLKNLKGLDSAYIFGSYAQGKLEQESDIDILLIGSHSTLQAKKLILDLQKQFKREFNIIDLTEKEFKERRKKKDEFIKNVFSNEIIKII